MLPNSKLENYTFDQFRIDFNYFIDQSRVDVHKFCNYIPGVSTFTNLIAVFEKHVFLPEADSVDSLTESRYYTYLRAQDFQKDWLLFIPIANTIFCLLRACSTDSDIDTGVEEVETNEFGIGPIDKAEKLYIEELVLKTNEQISKIINDASPETSQNEIILSSGEISKLLNQFFIELKDCQFDSKNSSTSEFGMIIKEKFFENMLKSFEDLSTAQAAILVQGLRGCDPVPTVVHYYGCGRTGHRFNLNIEIYPAEIKYFSEVISLYDSNPDVAKLLLNQIIQSYCNNNQIYFLSASIQTKEQAIDYLNACDKLSHSLKEYNQQKLALFTLGLERFVFPKVFKNHIFCDMYGNEIYNDNKFFHRKFLLREKEYSQEKEAIIEAFNEKGIDYNQLLPKDCFSIISTDIANNIYSQLSIVDLANISMTCKPKTDLENEKPSANTFVTKHLKPLTTRLIRLFELLNMIKTSKLSSTKQRAFFYEELNSLLEELKKDRKPLQSKELLRVEKTRDSIRSNTKIVTSSYWELREKTEYFTEDKTFHNHLLELIDTEVFDNQKLRELSKDFNRPLIRNCFTFLFDEKSDEHLSSFLNSIFVYGHAEIKDVFFNELTEERQERLISLMKSEKPFTCTLMLESLFKNIEKKSANNLADENNLLKIAEKLMIAFYNEIPDFFIWITPNWQTFPSFYTEYLCMTETLHFLKQPITEGKSCIENLTQWTMEHLMRNANIAKLLDSPDKLTRYLERTLTHIFSEEESNLLEEKLITFTHTILVNSLNELSENFKALLEVSSSLSHHQTIDPHAIIFKTIFQLLFSWNSIYKLFPYIKTEQEVGIILETYRKLPEPQKTFQLSILKEHICNVENGFSKEICDIFKSNFQFNETELNHIKRKAFKIQRLVDSFLSLETPTALKKWLQDCRKDHFCLHALAQGIKLPNGTVLQNSLNPEIIRQAFRDEKLYYKGYEGPIDLVEFLTEDY